MELADGSRVLFKYQDTFGSEEASKEQGMSTPAGNLSDDVANIFAGEVILKIFSCASEEGLLKV